MKKILFTLVLSFVSVWAEAGPITYTSFGSMPEATFGGSGIPNDYVAITTIGDDYKLGLTAHQRFGNPAVTNDGAGTFFAGVGGDTLNGQPGYGIWNIAFDAINYVGGSSDNTIIVEFLYDSDPGVGTPEGSLGSIKSALAPGGTSQNSWNLGMGFLYSAIPGVVTPPTFGAFSPLVSGEYEFALIARTLQGIELGRSDIRVNVGDTSPIPVPEPASLLLLGTGLAGIAAKVRKRKLVTKTQT